jgi:hypothetical protein
MEERQNIPQQLPPLPELSGQVSTAESNQYQSGIPGEAPAPSPISGERLAPSIEQAGAPQGPSQGFPAAQPVATTQIDDPQSSDAPAQDDTTNQNPLLANDVDVIEKEWVERAKAIVEKTRSDPYMQEQKVTELQSDYLKKRYGKELKPEKA